MYKNGDTPAPPISSLYEMLNDCSIDRVMAIDMEWCVIAWNNTATTITGIQKADIIGRPLLEVFPQLQQDKEIMTAIQFAFLGKKSFVPAKAALFNRQHYENHFIPLTGNDGQVKGVMNIMHDVAHREKAENQLQKLNRVLEQKYRQLEAATTELATYTYITSNDIKEPLRHVYTAFELLVKSEGKVLSNAGKASLRRIQASLNRMNLLLDDIHALSQINSFMQVRQAVDLNEVFNNALVVLKNKITENKALVQAKDLPVIQGFKDMLQTLFVTLLDNALKFQTPGNRPQIVITWRILQPEELPAGIQNNEKQVALFTFTDNGIGFEPADARRIFTMFEKLHPKNEYPGPGMGLTVARKIVEAHDGIIQATGTPGQGAVFQCYLPVNL